MSWQYKTSSNQYVTCSWHDDIADSWQYKTSSNQYVTCSWHDDIADSWQYKTSSNQYVTCSWHDDIADSWQYKTSSNRYVTCSWHDDIAEKLLICMKYNYSLTLILFTFFSSVSAIISLLFYILSFTLWYIIGYPSNGLGCFWSACWECCYRERWNAWQVNKKVTILCVIPSDFPKIGSFILVNT